MGIVLVGLGGICVLAAVVAYFIILIEAWNDEAWKAILSVVIPIYGLYYAFAEFDHEYKWQIVLTSIFGGGLGGLLIGFGASMMGGR